jgi:hypothetical protein
MIIIDDTVAGTRKSFPISALVSQAKLTASIYARAGVEVRVVSPQGKTHKLVPLKRHGGHRWIRED